jgi:hypothetical protein
MDLYTDHTSRYALRCPLPHCNLIPTWVASWRGPILTTLPFLLVVVVVLDFDHATTLS